MNNIKISETNKEQVIKLSSFTKTIEFCRRKEIYEK